MYYVIQENVFRERAYDDLVKYLNRLDLEFEVIKFEADKPLVFKTDRKDVFFFGALQASRVKPLEWNPGILMTPNHDYEIYSKYYKDNLLNYDSVTLGLTELFEWKNDSYFIRPTEDTKLFTGAVYTKEQWNSYRESLYTKSYFGEVEKNSKVQYAAPKTIAKEIRFFIVDGKVITGSQYKLGSTIVYTPIIDQEAYEFCERMIGIYQLTDAFVMDVCLIEDEWKIIECGCINCAGFYESDVQKLLIALEMRFTNE